MRSPGDIKRALLVLRFDKRHRLPLVKIATDSGCSPKQIIQAMQLEATEVVLRRIDAYLNAPALHVQRKATRLLWEIEQLSRELIIEFGVRTLPMRDVQNLPVDQQKRMKNAMHFRLKRLLRERWQETHGSEIHFTDGLTYWQCKTKVLAREGKLAPHRKPGGRIRPRAMGQG